MGEQSVPTAPDLRRGSLGQTSGWSGPGGGPQMDLEEELWVASGWQAREAQLAMFGFRPLPATRSLRLEMH